MIKISDKIMDPKEIINAYPPDSIEVKIIEILSSSDNIYIYKSLDELKFELNLRINIISASRELNDSNFSFRTFRKSICNPQYWTRTGEGGFLIKDKVTPSDGIKDIFTNSSMYGTECATAIVIVYYKALLNIYPQELFNELFADLHLMNWHYLDKDLDIGYYENVDFLPGDCRYFKNPDVDPLTPEWQGENTIDLGDGTYYGHGLGIGTADEIIKALNENRKEGSKQSAYLMDSATRPNFKYLSIKYYDFIAKLERENYRRILIDYRNFEAKLPKVFC
ncbi:protein-glutamine gamma-glutamyltransferase [Paramaledivibacter caminithermalis]|jgi:protein-glutamine gamma-glutamyltransferase|uniref:Protein-glutamine gamma-glutamyltransferase n=1 Tax=Paramaledivibacter caminithermalis (strain DSM 15212 / CIP 107654 / DViRD3) TaxID=1121301 RepID=A0A1M6N1P4_PARC5|nr:protein-glutamine gamma-glutamyltransferase [Paramaledivibacter caminithermalis]SHJ89578.1 protein-glutamine gamma-glutamyltransferase [Paramaledivibacter caminithermalis DSM 15212]